MRVAKKIKLSFVSPAKNAFDAPMELLTVQEVAKMYLQGQVKTNKKRVAQKCSTSKIEWAQNVQKRNISPEDFLKILDILENPPAPTETLIKAFENFGRIRMH